MADPLAGENRLKSGRSAIFWLLCLMAGMLCTGQSPWSSAACRSSEISRPVIAVGGSVRQDVGSRLEVLIDETRILTIGEVSSADYESRFTPAGEAVPNFGITEAAVWARFAVFNPTDAMQHRLLSFNFPLAGHIRFYYPERDGGFGRMEAGIAVPRSESLIPHRYYVFPLRVEPRERITCYLRVVSDASMVLPLTLWEPGALDRKD